MSKTQLIIALLFCVLIFPFNGYCQKAKDDVVPVSQVEAENYFTQGDYEDALNDYLVLLEKDPKNEKYNYRIAVCYLNSNIDKRKAIPYLEVITRQQKYNPNAMYLLGRAYHYAYRFDDAIKAYTKFKKAGKGTKENLADVDREIQYCLNAKELMKFPVDVTFQNLGKNVNSAYDDYYPFVPANESYIVFNSKRPGNKDWRNPDGSYPSTIYISYVENGQFTPAANIGSPIDKSNNSEEVIGLTNLGDIMLLYYNDQRGFGNIYTSTVDENGDFQKPVKLGSNINSKGHEIAASITADGSIMYFASDREGGYGGTDIYMSRKLPTGEWGPPVNLGPGINTEMDEDFPNISPDGKTLYFSSNGHTSMGGYDIFDVKWNEKSKKWEGVKNLGYPINTPEDNMNFRISQTGRYGYISAVRKGGYGDLDIYRVTFNSVEPSYTVIKGLVQSKDSSRTFDYSDVFITVTDNKTQQIYGNYTPNPVTGRYIIILPPGEYNLDVQVPGFKELQQNVDILDKSSFKTEIDKNILIQPDK